MKVAAQTIGLDLVSVKPMAAPVGRLYFTGETEKERLAREAMKLSAERKKIIDQMIKDMF